MATADVSSADAATLPTPRWGVVDALVGWVLAEVAAMVIGSVILALAGYTGQRATIAHLPLSLIALTYPPLWLGFVGVPVWAATKRGNGLVNDFAWRFAPIDLPIGIAAGVASQLLLVPLVSLPVLKVLGRTTSDLEAPARTLADKAHDPLGVILLFVIVVFGAPIAEELFFRGLVMRSVERHLGRFWAVIISAIAFGLTHFEGLQTPALIAFGIVLGWLVYRTGRLGTSIVAHMAFNAVSITTLLLTR